MHDSLLDNSDKPIVIQTGRDAGFARNGKVGG